MPQVWPLEGGYHDAITYNDDAMAQWWISWGTRPMAKRSFHSCHRMCRSRSAQFRARIECILASQIVVNGMPTVWPQQDDALTSSLYRPKL